MKNINEIISLFEGKDAYVLAYFNEDVCIGSIHNNELVFTTPSDYSIESLLEIRAFNDEQEVKYVFDDNINELVGPIITKDDDKYYQDKNRIDVIDEDMLLLGKELETSSSTTTLIDGRKKIVLPFVSKEANPMKLIIKVRNYIDYTDDDIAYVSHSRLVSFGYYQGEDK